MYSACYRIVSPRIVDVIVSSKRKKTYTVAKYIIQEYKLSGGFVTT